jgi:hypothetical protein
LDDFTGNSAKHFLRLHPIHFSERYHRRSHRIGSSVGQRLCGGQAAPIELAWIFAIETGL